MICSARSFLRWQHFIGDNLTLKAIEEGLPCRTSVGNVRL